MITPKAPKLKFKSDPRITEPSAPGPICILPSSRQYIEKDESRHIEDLDSIIGSSLMQHSNMVREIYGLLQNGVITQETAQTTLGQSQSNIDRLINLRLKAESSRQQTLAAQNLAQVSNLSHCRSFENLASHNSDKILEKYDNTSVSDFSTPSRHASGLSSIQF